jgi:hypothetical protein
MINTWINSWMLFPGIIHGYVKIHGISLDVGRIQGYFLGYCEIQFYRKYPGLFGRKSWEKSRNLRKSLEYPWILNFISYTSLINGLRVL